MARDIFTDCEVCLGVWEKGVEWSPPSHEDWQHLYKKILLYFWVEVTEKTSSGESGCFLPRAYEGSSTEVARMQ
jgi:hypothetical protein